MARYYKLIDDAGRPYITPTDRKALAMMVHCQAVAAHTSRKSYKIRISQDLGRITKRLEERAGDSRLLGFEQKDAQKMLRTVRDELAAGMLFYEMEVTEGTRNQGKYHFFA